MKVNQKYNPEKQWSNMKIYLLYITSMYEYKLWCLQSKKWGVMENDTIKEKKTEGGGELRPAHTQNDRRWENWATVLQRMQKGNKAVKER